VATIYDLDSMKLLGDDPTLEGAARMTLKGLRRDIFKLIHGEEFCTPTPAPPPPPPPTPEPTKGGPDIVVFDSSTSLPFKLNDYVPALQSFIDNHLAPVWGTPAKLHIGTGPEKGAWGFGFYDTADQPGALAYHDLTPDGMPLSKTFALTTIRNGADVSVAASHEMAEMLIDPFINRLCAPAFDGTLPIIAQEVADPVEADEYGFQVNGFQMTDFVHWEYYEDWRPKGTQFDYMRHVTKPFQILPMGYNIAIIGGQWKNIFGSKEKEEQFAKEDRRGHRSELRRIRWYTYTRDRAKYNDFV
jgi:hypothetical protein